MADDDREHTDHDADDDMATSADLTPAGIGSEDAIADIDDDQDEDDDRGM